MFKPVKKATTSSKKSKEEIPKKSQTGNVIGKEREKSKNSLKESGVGVNSTKNNPVKKGAPVNSVSSPRSHRASKFSPEFCNEFIDLQSKQYANEDELQNAIRSLLVAEMRRNDGLQGWGRRDKDAFRALVDAIQNTECKFDRKVWSKFKSAIKKNPTIKEALLSKNATQSSDSSVDVQNDGALMPAWNKPWSPQLEYVSDLLPGQSTALSDDFCGELVKMFQAHDGLHGANGGQYIPGPNGLPFVRKMIERERSRNSGLKGWYGKERNAFEAVEASLKRSPQEFNYKLWDKTWLRFRAAMEKYLTIEQLTEGSSESSKSSTKSSKSSFDEQSEGALMPAWNKPWSPQLEYVSDLLPGQSTALSGDFRGELVKMFQAHDGLHGANGGQYIPGPNGLPFVRKMIERERSRNSGLKGWHGKERNAFEAVEASLKRSPQEFNYKLWDKTWLRFRAAMEKHVDIN